MRQPSLLGRRHMLAGMTATIGCPAAQAAAESAFGTLLIAGPAGGRLDRWAEVLAPAIGRGLAGKAAMGRLNAGGIDGVTAANQFDARVEPDGTTALLVPGTAMLSWLTGEMRAHFDPARWIPLWVGLNTVVLCSRIALSPDQPLRIAASSPTGVELPILLALDLMGIKASLGSPDNADAIVVAGPSSMASALAGRLGMQPVMTLGTPVSETEIGRDPTFSTLPTAIELSRGRGSDEILEALHAASVFAQLDAGLFLPALTTAASVAQWRRACLASLQDPAVQNEASRIGARMLAQDFSSSGMSRVISNPGMLLTLRRWLSNRYDWRPT